VSEHQVEHSAEDRQRSDNEHPQQSVSAFVSFGDKRGNKQNSQQCKYQMKCFTQMLSHNTVDVSQEKEEPGYLQSDSGNDYKHSAEYFFHILSPPLKFFVCTEQIPQNSQLSFLTNSIDLSLE
jgi:hypothetical protein